MRLLRRKWLLGVAVGLAALGGVVYVVQRDMLFLASPFAFIPELWGLGEMEVVAYESYDGTELSAWYRPPDRMDAPVIVYFPGARGHLGWEGYRMEPFLEAGYGVFMMGYRGYGTNPGAPGEYSFYADASHAIRFLESRGHRVEDMTIYGYSLGTAVAVETATRFERVAGVVLEAPLASIAGVLRQYRLYVPGFMLRFRFNSGAKIARITAPILMLHGTEDEVITLNHAKALYRNARGCSRLVILDGGDHRNLSELGGAEQVRSFVAAVAEHDGGKAGGCPFCTGPTKRDSSLWARCPAIWEDDKTAREG